MATNPPEAWLSTIMDSTAWNKILRSWGSLMSLLFEARAKLLATSNRSRTDKSEQSTRLLEQQCHASSSRQGLAWVHGESYLSTRYDKRSQPKIQTGHRGDKQTENDT